MTMKSVVRRSVVSITDDALRASPCLQGLICHVAFAVDGQQFCIPTCYARVGETLYLHGSAVSRTLKTLAVRVKTCSSCMPAMAPLVVCTAEQHWLLCMMVGARVGITVGIRVGVGLREDLNWSGSQTCSGAELSLGHNMCHT